MEREKSKTNTFGWYAVQVRPNAGNLAQRNLERQRFETFLPKIEHSWKSSGRFRTGRRPLFPGYIFVSFDAEDPAWRKINGTLGVIRILSFNGILRSVPDQFIRELKACCGADGVLCAAPELLPGQQIRVIKGPFSDFIGQVERLDDNGRVWLLLDFLGQISRVGCAVSDVKLEANVAYGITGSN